MTTDSLPTSPIPPAVVPRWEWRSFGDFDGASIPAVLSGADASASDETYFLSRSRDASVKVRGGLLDIKVLQHVDGAGLQLWIPTLKAAFPLDELAAMAAFDALGLPRPRGPRYSLEELVREMVSYPDDVRVVAVRKVRHRSVLDGCMVEYTELTADGLSTRTVAVESPDTALVSETVGRLGLDGRPNTCIAKGIRALLGWEPSRFGVLDVGTNSVKLNVCLRQGDGLARTELDTAVVTRLGEGQADTGELGPEPMRRTVDAIADLVDSVRRQGPIEIVAVGTAGLRQAPNRDDFIDRVRTRCGVVVQVISGPEEARLAYQAAVSSLPRHGDRLLVFDSGGGSSQFTFGSPRAIAEQFSVDVGAVRLAESLGLSQAVPRSAVDAALRAVEAELSRLVGRPRPDTVIAIGGTSTNLAAVSRSLETYDPDVVHGTVITLTEVDRQIELYRSRSSSERRKILGLQPARADVILAGACIVRTILAVTGQDAFTVSDRGVRHGVVAERLRVAAR